MPINTSVAKLSSYPKSHRCKQSTRQHRSRCHVDRLRLFSFFKKSKYHRPSPDLTRSSVCFLVFSVSGPPPLPRGEGAVGPVTRRRTHESENSAALYRVARQPRPVQASEGRLFRRGTETRPRHPRCTVCTRRNARKPKRRAPASHA